MKLVFLGPPGAGKGTQAVRMADRFGLRHASTGDIFRQAVAAETKLGRGVKRYLDAGELVPDELTSRVVEQMVVDREDEYILDGYPRTMQQGTDLEQMLQERHQRLDSVLHFEVTDEEAMQRLTGRLVCPECGRNYHVRFMPPAEADICDDCGTRLKQRSDSSPQVVSRRLAEYHEKTEPLVEFYLQKGLLERIDASPPPDEVSRRAETVLGQIRTE